MRVSLCLDPRRPWRDLLALAEATDRSGLHTAYVPDHFMPAGDVGDVPTGPILEGWTVLSAIAAKTRRIRLGTLVLGSGYRHPAVLANMAATLDQVSGGRVTLGLGAGWQPNEHAAFGIELPAAKVRVDRLEETVKVVQALLRDDVTTFEGEHVRVIGARCEPKPLQDPLPLLVAGGGERRTIPLAARHAQAWHTWAQPAEFRRKAAVLDEACGRAGRDPADVVRLTGQTVLVTSRPTPPDSADDEHDADDTDDADIVGSADQVVTELVRYRDAGVDEFIVRDHVEYRLEDALSSAQALGADVIRHLD